MCLFFGDSFGVDIMVSIYNTPKDLRIPVKVLYEFCEEFGCDFKYTTCEGRRWIFTFDGLELGY